MYDSYKRARDHSWKILLEYGIKELPVDLQKIATTAKIKIDLYSRSSFLQLFRNEVVDGDGFIINDNGQKRIYLNDKINNRNRRRFTLAHELGHGLLNHDIDTVHYRNSEIDSQTDLQEMEANIFARDILMPATVLAALDIRTPKEIMQLCDISYQSAKIRAERMEELYQRDMFNKHPLERKVREQFDEFIRKHKK